MDRRNGLPGGVPKSRMVGLTSASVKRLSASPTENLPGYSWKPGNCANSDTVAITGFKPVNDCKSGIHFPNSFTPDNNGHNDTYRPVVQGQLDKFRLLIYNRYGEKVFETTNYRQGWNGVYNGQLQNVNQFVWLCYYQFSGEKEQMEKGVVFLLR